MHEISTVIALIPEGTKKGRFFTVFAQFQFFLLVTAEVTDAHNQGLKSKKRGQDKTRSRDPLCTRVRSAFPASGICGSKLSRHQKALLWPDRFADDRVICLPKPQPMGPLCQYLEFIDVPRRVRNTTEKCHRRLL